MSNSICGVDCQECDFKDNCLGCENTNGRPFGGECAVAKCCQTNGCKHGTKCIDSKCGLKEKLLSEINSLNIKDMGKITSLNSLCGSFVNIEYTLENGQVIKLLQDEKIYLGNQVCKQNSDRCYGVVADESHILICEYGEGGSDPKIIVYKKR